MPAAMRKALDDYPVPSPEAARAPEALSDEARRSLASLGYVSASAPPIVRKDAPRPADMVHLFDVLERASGLFVEEKYAEVIPLLQKIQAADPYNLDAALRLATAHSALGHDAEAMAAFKAAAAIAPRSPDVRTYLALHYARGREWPRAVPLLEQVVAETPERLPALEALAAVREKQGRLGDALALRQKVQGAEDADPRPSSSISESWRWRRNRRRWRSSRSSGRGAWRTAGSATTSSWACCISRRGDSPRRATRSTAFRSSHPDYPMALFKRAQVSVLLKEPDSAARIAQARRRADATTRPLIAQERLFK